MKTTRAVRAIASGVAAGLGAAAASYLGYAALTYARYGRACRSEESGSLLDRFMPEYEVVEHHEVKTDAPAPVTFAAARDLSLQSSAPIRAIFKAREWALGSESGAPELPRGIVEQTKALGWGVLAEIAGLEIVLGAITQPWDANPVFHSLPPHDFAAFSEPGYVKIVWNLRADPIGNARSTFRTETRAIATDLESRSKFRLYWSFVSPGVWLIRRLSLGPLKREAEMRYAAAPDARHSLGCAK